MEMTDYIRGPDGAFDTWEGVFPAYGVAEATALGVDPADFDGPAPANIGHYMVRWTNARGGRGLIPNR